MNITISQSERMHIATIIQRMTDTSVPNFYAEDAAELFEFLKDLPCSNRIFSIYTTINNSFRNDPLTNTGASNDEDEEKEHSFEFGKKHEFRCGTYVISRDDPNELNIRHLADVNADITDNEILNLEDRGNNKYQISLNKPKILNIPFIGNVTFTRCFSVWKESIVKETA